jgi:hypothetical protein
MNVKKGGAAYGIQLTNPRWKMNKRRIGKALISIGQTIVSETKHGKHPID